MKMLKKPNSRKTSRSSYLRYSGIAFQSIFIILLFLFAGIKLDEYLALDTNYFTPTGTILGAGLSFYYLFKSLIQR